jgi:hypothetical protein
LDDYDYNLDLAPCDNDDEAGLTAAEDVGGDPGGLDGISRED